MYVHFARPGKIGPSGTTCECDPIPAAEWRWDRFEMHEGRGWRPRSCQRRAAPRSLAGRLERASDGRNAGHVSVEERRDDREGPHGRDQAMTKQAITARVCPGLRSSCRTTYFKSMATVPGSRVAAAKPRRSMRFWQDERFQQSNTLVGRKS